MNYCRNCGEIIDPKLRRCPYCGKRNRQDAKEHRNAGDAKSGPKPDMKVIARRVILGVLVLVLITGFVYIKFGNNIRLRFSYKENMEQIKAYLETEDYLMLSECYAEWDSIYSGRAEYDSYYPVLRLSREYGQLYESILDYALATEENKAHELEMLVDDLRYYHRDFSYDRYQQYQYSEVPENQQHVANMLETVDDMLIVYCGFTEEETRKLDEISEGELYRIFDSKQEWREN